MVGYTDKFEKTGDPSMLHVSQRSPLCGFPGEILDELFLQQCTRYLDHSNVPGILAFKTRHVQMVIHDEIVEVRDPNHIVVDLVLKCDVVSVNYMSLESIPENSTPIPLAMEAEEIDVAALIQPVKPECPGESVSLEPIPKNNAPIPLAMEAVHIEIVSPIQPECSRHPHIYDIREVRFCHCRGSNTVEVQHAICCSIIGGTILLIYLILTAVF